MNDLDIDLHLKFQSCLLELYNFLNLEEDWDSYDGKPISYEIVNFVDSVMKILYYKYKIIPRDVAPLPNGGVQVEYLNSERNHRVEFDVDDNGIGVLFIDQSKERREYIEEHDVTLEGLFCWIESLLW